MSANEVGVAMAWIKTTLSMDSAYMALIPNGFFRTVADAKASAPFTLSMYDERDSHDEMAFQGVRAYSDICIDVCCTGSTAMTETLLDGAARMDTLLTVKDQTVISGGVLIKCIRSAPILSDKPVEGQKVSMIGGKWHIYLRSS